MKTLLPLAEAARLEGLKSVDFLPAIQALELCPELGRTLASPLLTHQEKLGLLSSLKLDHRAANTLVLLAEGGKISQARDLARLLRLRAIVTAGGALGILSSARPISEENRHRLEKATARRLGVSFVVLEPQIDTDLYGGFRIIVSGVTYDYSLAGALRDLGSLLLEV